MKKSIILSCLMACNIANCVNNCTDKSFIKEAVETVAFGLLGCSLSASYMFSFKYFKLGFENKRPSSNSENLNYILAFINCGMLGIGVAELSGPEGMKHPIFAKFCVAIGGIGTIAHFSYRIMKKRLVDRIIREKLEEDYRNQERWLEEERSRNDRHLGTIRLPR